MALPTQLTDRDVDLEVIPTGLLTFAAQTLGNAATDSDGHAEDFAAAVSAFALGAAQVAELEPLLSEHFAGAIDVTSDLLPGETAQLGKDLATGTQVLTDLDALFATQATPAPPSGGGSGSVGGGG